MAPLYAQVADGLAARAFPAGRRGAVLEVGAGTGLFTRKAWWAGAKYVASDISRPMLACLRSHLAEFGADGLALVVADVEALPFAAGSFDLIIGNLTPLAQTATALREARRVLRDGGWLALSIWGNDYGELDIINQAREAIGEAAVPRRQADTAEARLRDAGFDVQREDVDLWATHASTDAYLDHRRAFGVPAGWSADRYSRFIASIGKASSTKHGSGPLEVHWRIAYLIARAVEAPTAR